MTDRQNKIAIGYCITMFVYGFVIMPIVSLIAIFGLGFEETGKILGISAVAALCIMWGPCGMIFAYLVNPLVSLFKPEIIEETSAILETERQRRYREEQRLRVYSVEKFENELEKELQEANKEKDPWHFTGTRKIQI